MTSTCHCRRCRDEHPPEHRAEGDLLEHHRAERDDDERRAQRLRQRQVVAARPGTPAGSAAAARRRRRRRRRRRSRRAPHRHPAPSRSRPSPSCGQVSPSRRAQASRPAPSSGADPPGRVQQVVGQVDRGERHDDGAGRPRGRASAGRRPWSPRRTAVTGHSPPIRAAGARCRRRSSPAAARRRPTR